ncbi:MAG: DUF6477 family protein [Pseudomonadota bacterium]
MTPYISRLAALTRPRILVRAAQHRAVDFKRDLALRRLMQGEAVPGPGQAFDILFERETIMNASRSDGNAAYSPARHVELLAALIHEAKIAELRLTA